MKPYEALFILTETIRDENVEEFASKARAEIERLGGVIDQSIPMGRRPFAQLLHKREGGVFLRLDFHLDPAKIAALQARYKLNEQIFRMQLVSVMKAPIAVVKTPAPAAEAAAPAREA